MSKTLREVIQSILDNPDNEISKADAESARTALAAEQSSASKTLRESATEAHNWLRSYLSDQDEDCGDPKCAECKAFRPVRAIADALDAALAAEQAPPRVTVEMQERLADVQDRLIANDKRLKEIGAELAAAEQAQPVDWQSLACILIDRYEGVTITEEMIHDAISAMLSDPRYTAPPPAPVAQPVAWMRVHTAQRDLSLAARDQAPADFNDEQRSGWDAAMERMFPRVIEMHRAVEAATQPAAGVTMTDKQAADILERFRASIRLGWMDDGEGGPEVADMPIPRAELLRLVKMAAAAPPAPVAQQGEAVLGPIIRDLLTAGDLLNERWKARNHAVGRRLVEHANTLQSLAHPATAQQTAVPLTPMTEDEIDDTTDLMLSLHAGQSLQTYIRLAFRQAERHHRIGITKESSDAAK